MSRLARQKQKRDLVVFLSESELFHTVGPEELAGFLRTGRVRRVRRGDILFRQGETSHRAYVLLEGTASLVRTAPKGHRIALALLRPGDTFGFIDLFGRADQTYTAEIVEEGRVLSWPRETMRQMIALHPVIMTNALRVMACRIQAYWLRLEDLSTVPVERRMARTLVRLTNGTSRKVSLYHRDLAEFVGTTPPTLSRILQRWRRRGLVKASRASLQLLKPDQLRSLGDDP
jgi:CRP-like cAMP-binding protein